MAKRRSLSKETAKRYVRKPKKQRGFTLHELCALAGYGRS
jgi:ribosomal protein L13E